MNADGHREILGDEVTSAEDGAGWLAFLRGLVARGLTGVQVVKERLGHGSISTTERYLHTLDDAVLATFDKIRSRRTDG